MKSRQKCSNLPIATGSGSIQKPTQMSDVAFSQTGM